MNQQPTNNSQQSTIIINKVAASLCRRLHLPPSASITPSIKNIHAGARASDVVDTEKKSTIKHVDG
jgi:hypothetical protein